MLLNLTLSVAKGNKFIPRNKGERHEEIRVVSQGSLLSGSHRTGLIFRFLHNVAHSCHPVGEAQTLPCFCFISDNYFTSPQTSSLVLSRGWVLVTGDKGEPEWWGYRPKAESMRALENVFSDLVCTHRFTHMCAHIHTKAGEWLRQIPHASGFHMHALALRNANL